MKLLPFMKPVGILALASSFSILSGCSVLGVFQQEEPVPTVPEQTAVQILQMTAVKVEKITKQLIAEPIEVAAEVRSSQQIDIIAESGGEVIELMKKRGDSVAEGEVIAKLTSLTASEDRENALFAVNSIKGAISDAKKLHAENVKFQSGEIQKMKLKLDQQTKYLNKMRNDYDAGAVTKEQLAEAENELKQLRLDYDLAKRNLNTGGPDLSELELQLSDATTALQLAEAALQGLVVKAPLSGIVTHLPVTTGVEVPSGVPIGQVVRVDPIEIITFLSEEAAGLINGKNELTYYLPENEQRWKGKITYLATVMDPEAKGYELSLEVPNQDYVLKPGMKVLLQLTDETEQTVLSIPQHSVLMEGEVSYVYVVEGDIAVKRLVELGRSNDMYYEVLSGVTEGELLVVSGQNRLSDQEIIQVME